MRDGFVDIHVLSLAEAWIEIEINFVAKKIVEVRRRKRVSLPHPLLESSLHGARLFRLQQWVRDRRESASIPKRLSKRRLLDSGCVGGKQAGPGKECPALQRQECQGSPGHELVAEAFVMDKAA